MANEALAWPNEPTVTDAVDGTDNYNMGAKFDLVAGASCVGVRWRVPDSVATPAGGTHVAAIWTVIPEARIAFKEFTPVPGGYQDILFDTPVALSASPAEYVVSVHTRHYVFSSPTPSSGWVVESPSGNVRAEEGKLAVSNGGPLVYPASLLNAWYYVSPLMDDGGAAAASPAGLAVAATPGTPTTAVDRTAAPAGHAVPVALGAPTVALARTAAPAGLAVAVALGSPTAGRNGAAPGGLAVTVAAGQPVVAVALNAAPGGIAAPVAPGSPSPTEPGRAITPRPFTGTTARPNLGVTPRP